MTGALAAAGAGGVIDYPNFVSETINDGTGSASYTMKSNGSIVTSLDTSGTLKWIINTSPANYEVYATVTSGTLTSGSTGSWLPFTGSDYTWEKIGAASVTFQLQLRDKFTTSVVKTVSIVLQP